MTKMGKNMAEKVNDGEMSMELKMCEKSVSNIYKTYWMKGMDSKTRSFNITLVAAKHWLGTFWCQMKALCMTNLV